MYVKKEIRNQHFFSHIQLIVEHNDILDLEFISRTEDFKHFFSKINELYFKVDSFKLDLISSSELNSYPNSLGGAE